MKTFLFQGDSITDAGRSRDNDDTYGLGYPTLFAADYLCREPQALRFYNRAVSGDRSVDLYARIKRDAINLKPDYMSVLIGVNDVWHEIGSQNGVCAEKYERVCEMFYTEVQEAVPGVTIFVLEPFVLKGAATEAAWDVFRPEVEKRAVSAKRLADKLDLVFVPLQAKLDEVSAATGTAYWLCDGVHPAPAGHALIKNALAEAFEANR